MSLDARDLILNLLNRNPKKRLGASEADSEDLKKHQFFKSVNWEDVAALKVEMPKIQVNQIKFNQDSEQVFRKGEMESEANMLKVYKQISASGLDVRPKDSKNQEFQDNP